MITKPHKDIIIFIILAISFSISLYNLSQKGTFQINLREFGRLPFPVSLRFRLTCITDIWTMKSWHWKRWKCWFRNKYENNKVSLYWKFKVYARFAHLGCPRESFLAIKSGSSQKANFLMVDRNTYSWQHIKNLDLSEFILAIKFLHGRVLLFS